MNLFAQGEIVDVKPPKPRPHQELNFKELEQFLNSNNRTEDGLFIAPVAYGKSYAIGYGAHVGKGNVLVLQPNKELLRQNIAKYRLYAGQHSGSIYSASAGEKRLSSVTFATPLSLKAFFDPKKVGDRKFKADKKKFNELNFRIVLIDETEFGMPMDGFIASLLKAIKPKKRVGFTASPVRLKQTVDGAKLIFLTKEIGTKKHPKLWRNVVTVCQIAQVKDDYWSKLTYDKNDFDTSLLKLNKKGSEFTEKSILMANKANAIGDKVEDHIVKALAAGRKSILVFSESVAAAERLERLFPGVCRCVSSETKTDVRDKNVEDFKALKFQVMANVRCFTRGFDHQLLDAIILGYPTMSWALYYQMLGRGVRIYDKDVGVPVENRRKKDCLIVDLCDNVNRFGPIEEVSIENIKGAGWGIYQSGFLMTGVAMKDPPRSREEVMLMADPVYKEMSKRNNYRYIHFGSTYRSKRIDLVDDEWLYNMVHVADRTHWDEMMYKFLVAANMELFKRASIARNAKKKTRIY